MSLSISFFIYEIEVIEMLALGRVIIKTMHGIYEILSPDHDIEEIFGIVIISPKVPLHIYTI